MIGQFAHAAGSESDHAKQYLRERFLPFIIIIILLHGDQIVCRQIEYEIGLTLEHAQYH